MGLAGWEWIPTAHFWLSIGVPDRREDVGIAVIGQSLAMAHTTTAKHAIQRVGRFLGNLGINLEVVAGDLIATVSGAAHSDYLTLDWTDPK